MKCKSCKKFEVKGRRDLCDRCYAKQWRKNNPEKIKEYLERSKEQRKKVFEKYYEKNLEKMRENNRKYAQTETWKKQRQSRKRLDLENIRRKTRIKYPLEGNKCEKCNLDAKHRHHTTNPIEVDKFVFLCHKHHMKEHNRNSYQKDAVFLQKSEVKE